jgi:hypothetical protein
MSAANDSRSLVDAHLRYLGRSDHRSAAVTPWRWPESSAPQIIAPLGS